MKKTISTKIALAASVSLALAFTISCSSDNDDNNNGNGSVVQNCNAQTFETTTIGTQTWMAENLNCNIEGSKCYNDDDANCATYGRLYNWATAMALDADCNSSSCSDVVQDNHQGICPSGWHIPSEGEWNILKNYVDNKSEHLKATSGWNEDRADFGLGEDTYSFAGLPGGIGSSNGSFRNLGSYGYWWVTSEYSANNAYYFSLPYYNGDTNWGNDSKSNLISIRCIKN